jgi:hypothetical protein
MHSEGRSVAKPPHFAPTLPLLAGAQKSTFSTAPAAHATRLCIMLASASCILHL